VFARRARGYRGTLDLAEIRAVLFDFIGTLVDVKGYSLEVSKMKLYRALVDAGFNVSEKDFLDAYTRAHENIGLCGTKSLLKLQTLFGSQKP
jgi:phosphoglycolate phosphatase-like HAD superfamily hydrolase